MRVHKIEGKSIYLRPLRLSDINSRYLSWLNDKRVTRYMEGDKYPRTVKGLKQFFYKIRKSRNDLMMAIVLKKNNRHIGNIKLGTINWFHCFGDLGIMIGEKSCWNKGYGQEACRLFLGYAFNKLKMHKVTLGVHAQHLAAIRAYSKVGFRKEGRISGLWRWGRKFEDKILMGISKSGLR